MRFVIAAILIIIFNNFSYSKDSLVYAPVGTVDKELNLESHKDIMNFISSALGKKVIFSSQKDYYTLLENFKKDLVDIAFLGPLTYAFLKTGFDEYEPIATVMSEDGTPFYRCFLVRSFDSPEDPKMFTRLALTNPYSTCGYFGVKMILAKQDLNLDEYKYFFLESHDKVATEILLRHYDAGGLKDTVFKKYEGLLLKIVGYSEYIPENLIVVNKKSFSTSEIEALKEKFSNLTEKETSEWFIGKYGFYPYFEDNYKKIEELIKSEAYKTFFEKTR